MFAIVRSEWLLPIVRPSDPVTKSELNTMAVEGRENVPPPFILWLLKWLDVAGNITEEEPGDSGDISDHINTWSKKRDPVLEGLLITCDQTQSGATVRHMPPLPWQQRNLQMSAHVSDCVNIEIWRESSGWSPSPPVTTSGPGWRASPRTNSSAASKLIRSCGPIRWSGWNGCVYVDLDGCIMDTSVQFVLAWPG